MKAKIIDIKRFAVHDGDGIRTTAFLKGCPLKCVWCHNPESIDFKPQLAYYPNKCIGCGECVNACEAHAHTISDNGHGFDRSKCVSCGKCEEVCLGNALTFYGKEMTSDELCEKLLEDKDFYSVSGGGITLSGGECLMHPDFCAEVLEKCKSQGVNTAVDTCGFVSKEALDKVIPFTDMFLYDIKAFDEDVHIKCTGVSNKAILENIKYLDNNGCKIEVRIPFVPGFNADQIQDIAKFLAGIKNLVKVRVLAYHNFAGSKYASLDMKNTLPETLPIEDDIEKAVQVLTSHGISVVK